MVLKFNFNIESESRCSKLCLAHGIKDFRSLCNHIKNLPYGRTKNRSDYASVLIENKGTCSTKHALLKQVAIENNQDAIQLYLGIYKMKDSNTKGVKEILKNNNLDYIPEAHTYLKIEGKIIDITRNTISSESFENTLLLETEILPNQIAEYKIQLHKAYLTQWLSNNKLNYSFEDIWGIRELCIAVLSS